MNQIDLKNRIAAISGGARGIGLATAERFIRSGAKVAIWDMDGAEAAARRLEGAIGCTVDVTDEKSVAAALAETERRLGPVDILVASAGIAGPNATVADYPVDAWRKVIEVDLNGVFLCCRAVVPGMVKRNYGRIVNIASIAGKEGNPNAAPYSAAKAGVISLTKSLGKELAQTGVRVNCITPAAVKTAIFDQITQQHIDYMLSKIPMGRFGTVEEMAAIIAWLASEECSFTTGGVFDVSGGRATY
ncbi:MAG TPA: SDR family NAD(P)-dependent oxidoreductase [Stellaceae bacterium]